MTDLGSRVSRATLALQLEDALRADILAGDLRPGQRLRAAEIAPRYGVSATPLREALQRLAVEGLVVLDARVGVTVAPISRDDLRDVYETRIVLESEALRRSIALGDDAWLARVEAALIELRRITPTDVPSATADGVARSWSIAHRQFDLQLYGACDSPYLLRFIDTLSKRCERYRRAAGQLPDAFRKWMNEHDAIYQAVRARSADGAVTILAKHLLETREMVERELGEVLSPS